MPHHHRAAVSGRITDVFAHRFVVETSEGQRLLADLGPKGTEMVALRPGLDVRIEGEQKPSELKVDRISVAGARAVEIVHKPKPHHGPHDAADPSAALGAVKAAGYEPLGAPRRKPKHFEILARRGHAYVECHVELDGHIRKRKPVAPHDEKWVHDIAAAA